MTDQNTILGPRVERPELDALLKRARETPVSEEQMREQRVSFAYGNAPFNETRITKDSVRSAATAIGLKISA